MGDNPQEELRSLQLFTLDGVKAAMGISEHPTHDEVAERFGGVLGKIDEDLKHGFYVWVADNDLGHCGTYNTLGSTKFVVLKTIINGMPVRTSLNGVYSVSGHEVSIDVDQEHGDPLVTSNVFLDQRLVASRTSSNDSSGLQAGAFLRSLVTESGEDPSRLDATITSERSPYPFVQKMLQDFLQSKPDGGGIEAMFKKMQSSGNIVRRVAVYRVT